MSNVIAADAWPSIFWTALTFAPADTARLAALWRRPYGVVRGTPDSAAGFGEPARHRVRAAKMPAVVAGEQQIVACPALALARQVGKQELGQRHSALLVRLRGADEYLFARLDGVLRDGAPPAACVSRGQYWDPADWLLTRQTINLVRFG